MNRTLLILIFGILIQSCSSSKIENGKIRYFNENNSEITKSEFTHIHSTKKYLSITGDSLNHKKLILREKRGEVNNIQALRHLLEKATNSKYNNDKPIVIIYYPGKDACNSSGFNYEEMKMLWYRELELGLYQIAQIKPIYIYKNNEGLGENDEILTWYKDPENTFERLFFKQHYPCQSFVVLSRKGDFISYFGEFPKEYVWEATQIMNK